MDRRRVSRNVQVRAERAESVRQCRPVEPALWRGGATVRPLPPMSTLMTCPLTTDLDPATHTSAMSRGPAQ